MAVCWKVDSNGEREKNMAGEVIMNEAKPGITRIGWIGTGIMGAPMCGHVMDGGYSATVFNRTKSKAQPLLDRGAVWVDSPRAVAECSDIVFTIVGFPEDVREVYFGEDGVLAGAAPGSIVVDMTTTEPSLSQEMYAEAAEKDVSAIDAPVSGGDVGAINAALSIMVGGDKAAVDAVMPLFELMGKSIGYQGGAGAGQHTKMCNQITLSGIQTGVAQALIYGYKAGLDLDTLIGSISKGAAGCWVLDHLAPRIARRDFAAGFYIEHYLKDLGIALKEAKQMKLKLPGLELAIELYERVRRLGHGRDGYQALVLALEDMSGVEINNG